MSLVPPVGFRLKSAAVQSKKPKETAARKQRYLQETDREIGVCGKEMERNINGSETKCIQQCGRFVIGRSAKAI